MKKRILACLLTLCMMVGLVSAFALSASAAGTTYTMSALCKEENGTFTVIAEPAPGDKVTISNAKELNAFSKYTNAGGATAYITFVLTDDIVLNKGTFGQNGEWSEQSEGNTPVAFTPIGEDAHNGIAFRGVFNGNGHTVSGLYVNADRNFVGLFGNVAAPAVIRDLTVENSFVAGGYYVGGIVGFAKNSATTPTIDNCTFNGTVIGYARVGGIVGGAYGCTITNAMSCGAVNGAYGAFGIGGIMGSSFGNVEIINCMNTASVGHNEYISYAGGIVGSLENGELATVANCVNTGIVSASSNVGGVVGIDKINATISNCYYVAANNMVGVGNVAADVATATTGAADLNKADYVMALNALLNESAANLARYNAWTAVNGQLTLTGETAQAKVTAGTATYVTGSVLEATVIAAKTANSTVTLLRNGSTNGGDISGTYTFDFNGKHLAAYGPLTVSEGALLFTDSTDTYGGICGVACSALVMSQAEDTDAPTVKIDDGYMISRPDPNVNNSTGTIAVVNQTEGDLILCGTPYINGGAGVAIYVGHEGTLYGSDGENDYEGNTLSVACGWIIDEEQILAKNAKEDQFVFTNFDTSSFNVYMDGDEYVTQSIAIFPWFIFAIAAVATAVALIFMLVHTVRYKRRMKYLSFSFPVLYPILMLITSAQGIAMGVMGGICVVAVVSCVLVSRSQTKKYNTAKAAKAQADAAKAAEQAAAEQAAAEQAAAEQAAAEQAAIVEEPIAEAVEEATETVVEEAAEEIVEEATEAIVEEAAEEIVEVATEAVVEEAAEEIVEEATEATTEETAEEIVEEAVEETLEEPVAEADEEDEAIEAEGSEDADATAVVTPAAPPKVRPDRLVVAETDANGNVIYSAYKKSFTARVIQSPADVQERYETLKNALLSYKKVNSRVSWSYDSIKSGRKQLAKFAIRGKSLCLFLALDPNTLEGSKYNIADAGKSKKYETVPCRLRLSSKRSIKWGLELIAILAEREGLETNPKFKPKEWRMENETTESLIEKGLIKKVV